MQPLPATLTRDLARAAAHPHDADARAGVGRGIEWVQTHLSHVFGKVGVSSRVQLAAEAGRRTS